MNIGNAGTTRTPHHAAHGPCAPRVVITGGTGSLGRHLVRVILERDPASHIVTLSRHERELRQLTWEMGDAVDARIADVADLCSIRDAVASADCLIHLAAMKHLDLCERHAVEAARVNVVGTLNVLSCFRGNSLVALSTDKAVNPAGCYGATKMLLERMVLDRARTSPEGRYMVVRSGNFLASSGSVIERWRQQIADRNEITVTDPEMTRFFIGLRDAAQFVWEVARTGESGRVHVPEQRVLRIGDLARAVMLVYGNAQTRMTVSGIRPGEKVHEVLFLDTEEYVARPSHGGIAHDAATMTVEGIAAWLQST